MVIIYIKIDLKEIFSMEITYLGHSSFLIKDSKGRTVLTDPFDETVGYRVFDGEADLVTISHHHFDHDNLRTIKGHPQTADKIGFFYFSDIPVKGIPSYHDKVMGEKRGANTIFTFDLDGYKLCHLGDLGHTLTSEDVAAIGPVDILFIPVGGNFTIDGNEAAEVCAAMNSHIVIPMHYKTHAVSIPIEGPEQFITQMKNAERVGGTTLNIEGQLQGHNVVKILEFI